MPKKTALITGYTGQDGTFLTDLLLQKGYKVIGLVRRVSTEPPGRIRGRFDFTPAIDNGDLVLENGDLLSVDSLIRIIREHRPDEIYNLAAQSDVHLSFMQPEFSIECTFLGVVNLITALEAVYGPALTNSKGQAFRPPIWKMYQASTSEMFGDQKSQMDEDTKFTPNSPYAISKAAAHYYCNYKRAQGQFISCGILFNHESEIRGGNFVTQKIIREAVRLDVELERGLEIRPMELGNLDSVRDWGYAADYVKVMWLMLQQDHPDDFIVGTGETHTVRDFVNLSFAALDHKVRWEGEGKNTKGYVDNQLFVVVSDKYWRPVDVRYLSAKADKAERLLGWKAETAFEELVSLMVEAQLERSDQ